LYVTRPISPSFDFPISISNLSFGFCGRKERRATTAGTSHGARGCWQVGSGFAEVSTAGGSFLDCRERSEIKRDAHGNTNPFEFEFSVPHYFVVQAVSRRPRHVAKQFLTLPLRCRTASFSVHFLNAGRLPKFGVCKCFVFAWRDLRYKAVLNPVLKNVPVRNRVLSACDRDRFFFPVVFSGVDAIAF
jgi:hypothetical protein